MTHVVTKKCLGEQYASCVDVCPVDCFYAGEHDGEPFMIIDPDICIDCGLCIPECPVDAIISTPEDDEEFTKINADLSPQWKDNPKAEGRPPTDPPRKPDNKLVR